MRWCLALDNSHLSDNCIACGKLGFRKIHMQNATAAKAHRNNNEWCCTSLETTKQNCIAIQQASMVRVGHWGILILLPRNDQSYCKTIHLDGYSHYLCSLKRDCPSHPSPLSVLQSLKGLVRRWYSIKRHLQFYLEFMRCSFISGWYTLLVPRRNT